MPQHEVCQGDPHNVLNCEHRAGPADCMASSPGTESRVKRTALQRTPYTCFPCSWFLALRMVSTVKLHHPLFHWKAKTYKPRPMRPGQSQLILPQPQLPFCTEQSARSSAPWAIGARPGLRRRGLWAGSSCILKESRVVGLFVFCHPSPRLWDCCTVCHLPT